MHREQDARRLTLAGPPSLARAYLRGLTDRRPRNVAADVAVPPIEACLEGLEADPREVSAFRDVCGLIPGHGLPLTYPHVMAAGMHLHMLLDPAFPVRLAGVVHVWHRVHRIEPVPERGLDLFARLGNHARTAIGDEFVLRTELSHAGRVLWSEDTGFAALAPRRRKAGRPDEGARDQEGRDWSERRRWDVPADTGRRYAGVSGDWNPIHLYGITARLFGFRAPIAHGMWSLARCAGELGAEDMPGVEVEARFLRPLFLPAQAVLEEREEGGGTAFRLRPAGQAQPWLSGRLLGR